MIHLSMYYVEYQFRLLNFLTNKPQINSFVTNLKIYTHQFVGYKSVVARVNFKPLGTICRDHYDLYANMIFKYNDQRQQAAPPPTLHDP